MRIERADKATSLALARLLVADIAIGAALLLTGSIWCLIDGTLEPGLGLGTTGLGVTGFDGPSLLRLGIFVIILTPILRVVALAVLFLRGDDRGGVAWAIVVLLLVILATVLDVRH